MKLNEFCSYIDHTLLRPDASTEEIETLANQALEYRFVAVCVHGCHAQTVHRIISGSKVKLCVVVGFPLGTMDTQAKAYEARKAMQDGAEEIDMVINIGMLKAKEDAYVYDDICTVVDACIPSTVKVIIETSMLTEEEKIRACKIAEDAGASFVKTSTGFSTGGATVEDVDLMRRVVSPHIGVKASGGIRTIEDVEAMIDAGANRIGMSKAYDLAKKLESERTF